MELWHRNLLCIGHFQMCNVYCHVFHNNYSEVTQNLCDLTIITNIEVIQHYHLIHITKMWYFYTKSPGVELYAQPTFLWTLPGQKIWRVGWY